MKVSARIRKAAVKEADDHFGQDLIDFSKKVKSLQAEFKRLGLGTSSERGFVDLGKALTRFVAGLH